MKKQFRVKKSSDFKKILDYKKIAGRNASFVIYYHHNILNYGRVGISVSKKLANAVYRSKIRRQVRAMINKTDILTKSNDLVIIIKEGYIKLTFQENLNNLIAILSKMDGEKKIEKTK